MYNYKQYAKTYPQYFMLHKALPTGYTQQKYILATQEQYISNIKVGILINEMIIFNLEPTKAGLNYFVMGDYPQQRFEAFYDDYTLSHVGNVILEQEGKNVKLTPTKNMRKSKISLFRERGTYTNLFKGKIFGVTFYQSQNIIIDLVPCLDDKGIACLYDIINAKTYYSSSNTPFVKGE